MHHQDPAALDLLATPSRLLRDALGDVLAADAERFAPHTRESEGRGASLGWANPVFSTHTTIKQARRFV